jgi:hypothetical protein
LNTENLVYNYKVLLKQNAVTIDSSSTASSVRLDLVIINEAIELMAQRSGMNTDPLALARFAEDALLSVNRRQEAFNTYALLANQAQSHIGSYRALAKKYPELDSKKLFAYLVAAHPGEELIEHAERRLAVDASAHVASRK